MLSHTLEDSLTEVLNAHGVVHGCAPLWWSLAVSSPGVEGMAVHGDPAAAAAVRRWAETFELAAVEHPAPGTVDFRGRIDHVDVRVWSIVDLAAFDQALDQLAAGMPRSGKSHAAPSSTAHRPEPGDTAAGDPATREVGGEWR